MFGNLQPVVKVPILTAKAPSIALFHVISTPFDVLFQPKTVEPS